MKDGIYQAIILRTQELGESDLLVSFITPEWGRKKAIAKGAKKSKKRFVNALASFYHVNIEIMNPKKGKLPLVSSARLINSYRGLTQEYKRVCIASFIIELTETLFPIGAGDKRIFNLLRESLNSLSKDDNYHLIPIVFEIKAMAIGGFRINIDECSICKRIYTGKGRAIFRADRGGIVCMGCDKESQNKPGMEPETVKLLKMIYDFPFNQAKELRLSKSAYDELIEVIKAHRDYRLELPIRTWKYLE